MSGDPFDWQAEEQARAAREARTDLERQRTDEALAWAMDDPRGRRLIWSLLERAGVYRTTFTGEALSGAFAEGRRDQGLFLLDAVLRVSPAHYETMMREAMCTQVDP